MALSTADDYKLAVNQLLYWVDHTQGGIEKNAAPVYAQMAPEDFKKILSDYYTYKSSRDGNIGVGVPHFRGTNSNVQTNPPNQTTTSTGGFPVQS